MRLGGREKEEWDWGGGVGRSLQEFDFSDLVLATDYTC